MCDIPKIGGLVWAAHEAAMRTKAAKETRMNFSPSPVRISAYQE
jgi:hypothetical protein